MESIREIASPVGIVASIRSFVKVYSAVIHKSWNFFGQSAVQKIIYIAIFGALGATTRYLISRGCARYFGDGYAVGTLLVNVVGSFLIGFLMILSLKHPKAMDEYTTIALTTGFLGAMTTFSTFSYETLSYFQSSRPTAAFLNIGANLILGLLAAWAGTQFARLFQ